MMNFIQPSGWLVLYKIFKMKKVSLLIGVVFLFLMLMTSCSSPAIRLFAGRYNDTGGKGLYLYDVNLDRGTFKTVSENDAGPDPSYFCISGKNGNIYAANEVMDFQGEKAGGVTALSYDKKTGKIEKLKDLAVPYGGPCFISLSPDESYLLMANYSSSSVSVVKLDNKGLPETVTDTILFNDKEGRVSHPHMISFGPDGEHVYLTDLGYDRVVVYDFDNINGKLLPLENGIVTFPDSTGPRHFTFSRDGRKMYVICELNSTISTLNVDEGGRLSIIQTLSTVTDEFKGKSFCADVHFGINYKYLYGSNRGENDIVTFRVGTDGNLEIIGRTPCGGNWPRNFVVDPSGKYILVGNKRSGNISLLKIDAKTGIPAETGKGCEIGTPACLKF